jgi:hypothetical protein
VIYLYEAIATMAVGHAKEMMDFPMSITGGGSVGAEDLF